MNDTIDFKYHVDEIMENIYIDLMNYEDIKSKYDINENDMSELLKEINQFDKFAGSISSKSICRIIKEIPTIRKYFKLDSLDEFKEVINRIYIRHHPLMVCLVDHSKEYCKYFDDMFNENKILINKNKEILNEVSDQLDFLQYPSGMLELFKTFNLRKSLNKQDLIEIDRLMTAIGLDIMYTRKNIHSVIDNCRYLNEYFEIDINNCSYLLYEAEDYANEYITTYQTQNISEEPLQIPQFIVEYITQIMLSNFNKYIIRKSDDNE